MRISWIVFCALRDWIRCSGSDDNDDVKIRIVLNFNDD